MATIVATPGASNANSYLTLQEAIDYFATRSAVAGWDDADDQSVLVIMATRTIDMLLSPSRVYVPGTDGKPGYFKIGRAWTGATASSTQALAWPREGMFNRNGFPIANNVIPQDLKNAVAELAGALGTKDLLSDDDAIIQGITSVKAGSVAVSFNRSQVLMATKMLPDSVLALLVPSWYTDERIEGAYSTMFDVL